MALSEEWAKSLYSAGHGECVEARRQSNTTAVRADVRDSQNPHAGYLTFSHSEWATLLNTLVH